MMFSFKKRVTRVAFSLVLTMSFSPFSNAASSEKFDFLLRFFDLNEAAFAYHRHCVGSTEDLNNSFLRTLEFVADELFAEAQKEDPNMDSEYIKSKILERRYDIQYRLDNANMKEGCYSPGTLIAKAHYLEFSHYNQSEIQKFIAGRVGG